MTVRAVALHVFSQPIRGKFQTMEEASDHPTQPTCRLSDEDGRAFDYVTDRSGRFNPGPGVGPQRLARMEALVNLINQAPVSEPRPDLAARTVARARALVEAEKQLENEQPPAAPLFSFGWAQLATYAALIIVGLSLAFPAVGNFRQTAREIACAAHLNNVGGAFASYAEDYDQALPRLNTAQGVPWWNVGKKSGEGEPVESNSAHLYTLAREGYVNHHMLNCPNNEHAPHQMAADAHDWDSAREVSYSYQNQYTNQPINPVDHPEMAVLADKNPLFIPRSRYSLTYDDTQAPTTASRSHNSRGQNVLRNDGVVLWQDQPVVDGDNIWLIDGVDSYSGRERPVLIDDSFLVP